MGQTVCFTSTVFSSLLLHLFHASLSSIFCLSKPCHLASSSVASHCLSKPSPNGGGGCHPYFSPQIHCLQTFTFISSFQFVVISKAIIHDSSLHRLQITVWSGIEHQFLRPSLPAGLVMCFNDVAFVFFQLPLRRHQSSSSRMCLSYSRHTVIL